MFHFTNLGVSSSSFADLNGFIPEEGDVPSDFTFDSLTQEDFEEDSNLWGSFVKDAEASTVNITKDIERFQEKSSKMKFKLNEDTMFGAILVKKGSVIVAKKSVDIDTAIKTLQQKFPDIHGIKHARDYGWDRDAIHLGDCAEGGEINGLPACSLQGDDMFVGLLDGFDMPSGSNTYIDGVHKKLYNELEKLGYYVEPYDAGTWFAYSDS